MVRNVVHARQLANGHVDVLCVDEHLHYVHFTVPFARSTTEQIESTMHAVLDHRARRNAWRRTWQTRTT